MSQYPQYDDNQAKYGTRFPKLTLTARLVTVVSLIVSVAVLKTYGVTYENGYVLTYKDFRSFKYMFSVGVIGVVYTLLQIPFAIYYMRTNKHLIKSYSFLKFSFYADKIIALILAAGVGAGLGTTLDMKKVDWKTNEDKIQDFLTMIYIPSVFLLVACLASAISSVHSSLALRKIDP